MIQMIMVWYFCLLVLHSGGIRESRFNQNTLEHIFLEKWGKVSKGNKPSFGALAICSFSHVAFVIGR